MKHVYSQAASGAIDSGYLFDVVLRFQSLQQRLKKGLRLIRRAADGCVISLVAFVKSPELKPFSRAPGG